MLQNILHELNCRREGAYPCKGCGKVFRYSQQAIDHEYKDRNNNQSINELTIYQSINQSINQSGKNKFST